MNDRSTETSENTQSLPEVWLDEHGNVLSKFAMLRVRNVHLAEDLVQETLVKAFANLKSFRHEASVRTWLFSILRNEISRHFRNEKKHKSELDVVTPMGELLRPKLDNHQFTSSLEREEFWDMIQACFEQLPEHLLTTFLHRLANSDKTIETLCEDLDIQTSNFAVRMFPSRLLLKRCLEQNWSGSE